MKGKFANKLSKSKHGLIVSENAKSESARKELMKKTQQDSKLDEAFNEQIENANSQEKEKREYEKDSARFKTGRSFQRANRKCQLTGKREKTGNISMSIVQKNLQNEIFSRHALEGT